MRMNASKRKSKKGRLLTALFPRGQERTLTVFLTASVFLCGLYPYWCALLAGAFLALMLYRVVKKGKTIVFPLSLASVAICIAVLFYLLSVCWAIDKGMAFLGFLKYLPVPLFIILTATIDVDRERLLQSLARAGGLSVAICLILCIVPDLRSVFIIEGRFSGPFQYANAYGLFLLAGIVILTVKRPTLKLDYIICALCSLGVFLSGSRSLFVLAAVVFVLLLFINRQIVFASGAGLLAAVIMSLLFTMTGTLQRSADISFSSGEWLTRLAYYQDGLRLVFEKPFGLGHLGWWYMQPAIQTSVYDVRLIHNWLLQAALDIGVIPALFLAVSAVTLFFHKRHGYREKLLIALILGHGLIDFDLAFIPVVFILVLLLPIDSTVRLQTEGKRMIAPLALCSIAAAVSLWLGTASFLSYVNWDKAAVSVYPAYTEAMEKAIISEPDPDQALLWSNKTLSCNQYIFDAYNVKSKVYADKGMLVDAVEMKLEYLSIARLQGRDYDELLMYIHYAIQQAASEGDVESCRNLADLALKVPDTLEELSKTLSPLAYRLKHQPTLLLSEDSTRFLAYIQGFKATLE